MTDCFWQDFELTYSEECAEPPAVLVVDAGEDDYPSGLTFSLDGTVTPGTDPTPSLLWTYTEEFGETGAFADATIVDPTFTADGIGNFTFTLTATPSDASPVADSVLMIIEL